MRPQPLPTELSSRPFRVAEALDRGVSPDRLRASDLDRPFHGIRSVTAGLGARAYAPRLRDGDRFSHSTAAELWPLPLPREFGDVHVTSSAPRNSPRARGVIGHESRSARSVTRHGYPLSHPADLFVELATLLAFDDLVAVGDALVLDPHHLDPLDLRPWISLDELRLACAESRAPGSRRARGAIHAVRAGSESRPETRLRLLLVRGGLPEPELNGEIFDRDGRWIGRFDLVYREAKVLAEYDGDQHRTSTTQYEHDLTRIERAIEAGYAVIRVRARGLFVTPDETVSRVRRALSR